MIANCMKIDQQLSDELHKRDPIWHVHLVLLGAIILQLTLPDKFVAGPRLVLPVLEGLLLLALSVTSKRLFLVSDFVSKVNTRLLLLFIGLGNIYAAQRLSHQLLIGGKITNGHALILTGINIYLTNIIVFALLYWEMDGGGAGRRAPGQKKGRDFLFTQMTAQDYVEDHWVPTFLDYLVLSGNTSFAFSPTDTMPLTRTAKLLMLAQSFVSLVVIGLIAARAVNILS
jgi:hypothetical protein